MGNTSSFFPVWILWRFKKMMYSRNTYFPPLFMMSGKMLTRGQRLFDIKQLCSMSNLQLVQTKRSLSHFQEIPHSCTNTENWFLNEAFHTKCIYFVYLQQKFYNFHVGSPVIAFIGFSLQNKLLGKNELLTCYFSHVNLLMFRKLTFHGAPGWLSH